MIFSSEPLFKARRPDLAHAAPAGDLFEDTGPDEIDDSSSAKPGEPDDLALDDLTQQSPAVVPDPMTAIRLAGYIGRYDAQEEKFHAAPAA